MGLGLDWDAFFSGTVQFYPSHICNVLCLLISSVLNLYSASQVKIQVQTTRFCWCNQKAMVFCSAEQKIDGKVSLLLILMLVALPVIVSDTAHIDWKTACLLALLPSMLLFINS